MPRENGEARRRTCGVRRGRTGADDRRRPADHVGEEQTRRPEPRPLAAASPRPSRASRCLRTVFISPIVAPLRKSSVAGRRSCPRAKYPARARPGGSTLRRDSSTRISVSAPRARREPPERASPPRGSAGSAADDPRRTVAAPGGRPAHADRAMRRCPPTAAARRCARLAGHRARGLAAPRSARLRPAIRSARRPPIRRAVAIVREKPRATSDAGSTAAIAARYRRSSEHALTVALIRPSTCPYVARWRIRRMSHRRGGVRAQGSHRELRRHLEAGDARAARLLRGAAARGRASAAAGRSRPSAWDDRRRRVPGLRRRISRLLRPARDRARFGCSSARPSSRWSPSSSSKGAATTRRRSVPSPIRRRSSC